MDAAPAEDAAPPWWPVTTVKFVVMSLGTAGLYHYYWLYENWRRLRASGTEMASPFWRTFFAPFTVYRLFARAHESAWAHGVRAPWSAPVSAGAYFVANIALLIAVPAWLAGLILLLPVLPVQMTMARVNAAVAPRAERNGRITVANFVMLIGGALLTAMLWSGDNQVNALLKDWVP
jgi:hypothetical protein